MIVFLLSKCRIYWAGTEVSSHFAGQMEGAVRSAETAVEVIKTLMFDE
jgi:monoamine oxidase